ncbi:hypothetical protein A0H81_08772 [Grifola frondosa]|uniref:Uncharacterized protein n=1 Tax=Grifola frondosa TaxID=5627 RepID=A0A1C7M4Y2_GRIFR|nr:hypothetical protein A0H81_08772 [Grifola frondosa]
MVTLEHLGRIEPLTRAMTPVELAEVLLLRLREYEGCRSNAEVLGRTEDLLVSALSVVRSHLCSLSPINCLPPEILSLIFQFIPSVSHNDRNEPVYLSPYTFKNAHDVIAGSTMPRPLHPPPSFRARNARPYRCWLPPSRLLKALSGFPSLQKLVLGSIAAARDDAIVPVVELPDLRLLSLVHMEAAMYKLLHRLPRLALTDHLSKLLIKATTSEVQIVASGPSSSGVMFDADGLFYEEWLRAVPAVMPMASIREFSIRINHGMMRCLPELLSLMPSLTSLTLCDGCGDDVRWKEEDFVQISPNLSTYVSLVAIAASRAAEGCPLQHMTIEYGQQPMENSTDTFLDGALRACVESVELGVSLKRPPMKVPGVCPVKMQDGFWYDC